MKNKFVILIMASIILASVTSVRSQNSDSLTISGTIKLVLENHPAIKQADQYVASSKSLVDKSRAPYYPNITTVGSYARIGPVISLSIPDRESVDLYPANNYDLHLALRQTIYDFGRRQEGIKLAESGAHSAEENVDLVKSNLVYGAIGLFNSLILIDQNIGVLDEEIDALNQHLDVVKRKVDAGTATDFDVLTTQVKVSEVQNQKIDMVNAREKQLAAFRELTGLPDSTRIELAGGFEIISGNIYFDSLFTMALENLPEARLAREAETRAEIQYRMASLENRPTLNMNLEFGFKNGYIPDLNEPKANWIAGAMLTVPIFDGYSTKHKKAAAYSDLQASKTGISSVESRIATSIKQAISDLNASREKIETSELQVKQAETAYSIAESRYAVGVITNLDLLDAQLSLARARLVQQKARYDVVRSRYALDRAAGVKYW